MPRSLKMLMGISLGVLAGWLATELFWHRPMTLIALKFRPPTDPVTVVQTHLKEERGYLVGGKGYCVRRENVLRQQELGENNVPAIIYWSPKEVNQWAEVEYALPFTLSAPPVLGLLDVGVSVHSMADPKARAEVWLRSPARPSWNRVLELSPATEHSDYGVPLDVTDWLSSSGNLEVRIRLLGTRSLTHPDPDRPIGPAGGQAMRQPLEEEKPTLKLEIWH